MTHTLCYGTTGAIVMRIDGGPHDGDGHDTSNQTNYTAPNAITAGSLTTSLNWTPSLGLSNETGPNGDSMGIGYDSANRPSVTTTPYGAYTSYTYSTSPAQTTATVTTNDPNTTGRKTVTKLDGLGRTIEVDSIDASGVTRSIVQSQDAPCACSPLGKLSQQSMPYEPGDTPVWTVYTYDGLGRTLSVRAPDGASTTTYSYVGNTVTVTDPAGHWKKFTMDGFGNLLNVVEPDSSQTSAGGTAASNYIYDALNHLTQVIMGRQMPGGNTVWQTRTFNYNVGSSITAYLQSATNPENGTVSYIYNNTDGTLFSKTDAKGQTLKYARDSYGRVLTVSLAGSPDTVLRTYTYDTNSVDNTFSQNSQGRLTTVQYGVPSISSTFDNNNNEIDFTGDAVVEMYSYTAPGQVAAKRLRVTRADSLSENLTSDINGSWAYNNEGNMNGVTYPVDPNYRDPVTGNPVTPVSYSYSFDGMGRLAGMTESVLPTTLVSGVTYNAAGQMLTGLDTRTYNANGQLTHLVNSSMNITYNYSATQNNGKITSQVDNLSGETVTYAYDSLNRLLSATASSWNQSFVYDPFGNLTDKNGTLSWHGVPDATTNRLGSTDANGNASGATWDAENRMTANGTARYAYDGQNKRVWTCTATGPYSWSPCASETYFFYGPDGKLMAQFTPVYTLAYRDQQFQQHPATLTMQGGTTRAYFGGRLLGDEDRLGSRVGKYYPYGEDRSAPPPGNDQVKFATYTRDSATGLDYADQRYYGASVGRFMSPDPYMATSGGASDASSPQSWNRYAYVQNDPINYLDPRGLVIVGSPGDPSDPGGEPPSTWPFVPCTAGGIGFCPGSPGGGGGGGGGGGQSPEDIARSYLAKAIQDVIKALTDPAKPECAALFFGTTFTAVDLLNGLASGNYGSIDFSDITPKDGEISGRTGTEVIFGDQTYYMKVDITINSSTAGTGYWSEVGATGRDRMLLHELGHAANMLLGAGGSQFKQDDDTNSDSQKFNQDLEKKCFP